MEELATINFEHVDTDIPPWAKTLIDGMKIIIKELKSVSILNERVQELESYIKENETVTQKMQQQNKILSNRIGKLEIHADDQELAKKS